MIQEFIEMQVEFNERANKFSKEENLRTSQRGSGGNNEDSIKKTFNQLNIQHYIANIDQPLDKMLHRFLAARQALR